MSNISKKTIIERIPEDLKNKYFKFLLISTLLFLIMWYFTTSEIVRIITLVVVVFAYTLHTFKMSSKSEVNAYYLILIWLSFFIYIASLFHNVSLVLNGLWFMIVFVFLASLISSFVAVYNSKTVPVLIITYMIFTCILLSMFGVLYLVVDVFDGNDIKNSFNSTYSMDLLDYVYFSSTMYFSSNYGGFYPVGNLMRLITQFQVAWSFIIHIILLGRVMTRLENKKE